jgi:flavin-binding protein dodecin
MPVEKVTEISATSTKSFEDAVRIGVARAARTLRIVKSVWVKEQHMRCAGGAITEYQVDMVVSLGPIVRGARRPWPPGSGPWSVR